MNALGWIAALFILVLLLDAIRMRRRLSRLAVLATTDRPVDAEHAFVVAPGVELDDATRRAASAHAGQNKVQALDLVPRRLDTARILGLAQTVDPATYRGERLAQGRTACHAVLVTRTLAGRVGLTVEGNDARAASAPELVRLAVTLKRYASVDTDVAVAPGLRPVAERPEERWQQIREVLGTFAGPVLVLQLAQLGLLVSCAVFGGVVGWVALGLYHLQPLLAVPLGVLRPSDLALACLLRTPLDLLGWARAVLGWKRAPRPDRVTPARPVYTSLLATADRFFEPRAERCPVCDSGELERYLHVSDLLQHKPGRFTMERCRGCRHVFQNPRLSLEGLSYYYKDFYDGLGEENLDAVFNMSPEQYRARARMVEGGPRPARWLDVGGGHGHFCCAAREVWPEAAFDCLDIADSVDEGVRRGWIDTSYRGFFPDLAASFAGRYDVVSMSHYLEHTRDPRAEIAAARTALGPGGALLIEVPDPDSKLRVLGRLWLPHFQPQHQHLLSVRNLERILGEEGFQVARVERGAAHLPVDLAAAVYLAVGALAPPVNVPWRPASGLVGRVVHHAVWMVGTPSFFLANVADHLLSPLVRRAGLSNAYRVLARRQ
jgi:SAM-dependent methyltransferase